MSHDPRDEPTDEPAFDIVEALKGTVRQPPDATLGGYMERHDRPAAFEGLDGAAYTVDIDVEPLEDGTGFASFLLFIRWADTGAGIMDHRESDDVAAAPTVDAARAAALALPLERVKEILDETIRRRMRDEGVEEDR